MEIEGNVPYYNRKKLVHGMLCANKKSAWDSRNQSAISDAQYSPYYNRKKLIHNRALWGFIRESLFHFQVLLGQL